MIHCCIRSFALYYCNFRLIDDCIRSSTYLLSINTNANGQTPFIYYYIFCVCCGIFIYFVYTFCTHYLILFICSRIGCYRFFSFCCCIISESKENFANWWGKESLIGKGKLLSIFCLFLTFGTDGPRNDVGLNRR